ncbi:MAG: radical SAM protein [Deltaproteobacteria bacterium]|nr:radical SAM protein [Deltaproteobacteria bacterium]MDO9209556.1 radical SAM protein [Deltaproteobacteria bacterium]
MRIEFISAAAEDSARLTPLALATLAALTPPDIDVGFSDDQIHPIDLNDGFQGADLVAISVMSKTAYRAYQIADACREKGVKVVLGGIHPTVLPEEASAHADVVVVGEAEILWPRVIADFQANRLQRFYRQDGVVDMNHSPVPQRGIFKSHSRSYVPLDVVQTTRGCPFDCDFCTVNPVFGSRFRMREIEKVVAEVQGLTRWGILFADDNVIGNVPYFQKLFTALEPLKLRWIGEASLAGLDNEQNLKILQKSGCKALFIGFESLSPQLKTIGKPQNNPARYGEVIRKLHDHGIIAYAAFIFGFDFDDPSVFERTVEFAIANKVILAQFAILTPYPGTRLYTRLQAEGRLLQDKWWLVPNQEILAPHFRPQLMEPEQLREGWKWAWREFYSFSSIWKRKDFWPALHPYLAYLPFNLRQRHFARHKICAENTRPRSWKV